MVRVVSAQGATLEQHRPYDFAKIDRALKALTHIETENDHREHQKVLQLLDKFSSLEELMRGSLTVKFSPLRNLGWSLPAPEVNLEGKDKLVFEAIATRYLYPEVRLVEAISEAINDKVNNYGFVVSKSQRKAAQEICRSQKDLTESCLLKHAIELVSKDISEQVALDYQSEIPAPMLSEALLHLIDKGGATSVYYRDAFYGEVSSDFLKTKSTFSLIEVCLTVGESFFAWELVGEKHCSKALEKYLSDEAQVGVKLDSQVQAKVIKEFFNPFSEFQILMVSLSEDILNRGVLCYSQSCKRRKVLERLSEWSYANRFSNSQKRRLATLISKNWLE